MSQIAEVLEKSRLTERELRARGAQGRGLHQMITSLEGRLEPSVAKQLRFVASVRNRVVHDSNVSGETMQRWREAVADSISRLPGAGAHVSTDDGSSATVVTVFIILMILYFVC